LRQQTNFNVIMNFIILMGLCAVTAIIYGSVELKSNRSFNSFEEGSTPSDNKIINALVIFVYVLLPLPLSRTMWKQKLT
jgi:phospholipid-translocating ATPase